MEKLPKNEQIFVKEVAIHGNATKAVRKAFKEIKSPDYIRRKGSDLITKPHIVKAVEEVKKTLADRINDDDLIKVHEEGLKASRRVFKNNNSSGEIELVDEEPDYAVRHKYLDSAYKLKGAYAPEKSISLNLNGDIIPTEELLELANQLKNNEVTRIDTREHIERNGADTESVGKEVQD